MPIRAAARLPRLPFSIGDRKPAVRKKENLAKEKMPRVQKNSRHFVFNQPTQTNSLLYTVTTASDGCCCCSLGTVGIPADSPAEIPGDRPVETGLDCRTKSCSLNLRFCSSENVAGCNFGHAGRRSSRYKFHLDSLAVGLVDRRYNRSCHTHPGFDGTGRNCRRCHIGRCFDSSDRYWSSDRGLERVDFDRGDLDLPDSGRYRPDHGPGSVPNYGLALEL